MLTLWENTFLIGTDFKETFAEEVSKLIEQDLTHDFKNKLVQGLTDAYVEQTGEVPDSYELQRLATWIIKDNKNDPHKVSKAEYPVLSIDQQKLRWRREMVSEHMDKSTLSSSHKMNGKKKPKNFRVFGEYEGGY